MLPDRSWCFLFPFSCLLYKLSFTPHEQDYSDNMGYVFPNTSLVNKIEYCILHQSLRNTSVYFLVIGVNQLTKYHDSWEMSNARVVNLEPLHCLLLSLLIFCTCKPKVSMVTGVFCLVFFILFFLLFDFWKAETWFALGATAVYVRLLNV